MKENNGQSAAKQINLKDIPGYEGHYSISEDGEVWSTRNNKFLKQGKTHNGYPTVELNVDGKAYKIPIHKLVAITYVENTNPNDKIYVNHIDFNILNNYFKNLEWVTHYENMRHSWDAGRFVERTEPRKAYVFTNAFNLDSFTIIGIKNLIKYFGFKSNGSIAHVLEKYANTGSYINRGVLKNLMVDVIDLKVQRLTPCQGVGSSDPK